MEMTSSSTEISTITNAATVFTDGILAKIDSFDSVAELFKTTGVAIESFSDYGTGFSVVEKDTLINVPMYLIEWRFNKSKMNDDGFVSVAAVTKHNDKVIFNDGSSGILSQLRMVTDQRNEKEHPTPQCGLFLEHGLTRSDYSYTDEKGVERPASTFYLAE